MNLSRTLLGLAAAVICVLAARSLITKGRSVSHEVEFAGNVITFHPGTDKFRGLSHEERADHLARLAEEVLGYAQTQTGLQSAADLVPRLRPGGPGEILIGGTADASAAETLRNNERFGQSIPVSEKWKFQISSLVDEITERDGRPHGRAISRDGAVIRLAGVSDTEFRSLRLSQETRHYMARAMIYRDIVLAAGAGPNIPDHEKLEALLDWTFVNVSAHFEREVPPYPRLVDYNDVPLGLMLRGMGDCDRSVWVLATLAWHAGFEANIVYLHRTIGAISFHAVAEIKLNGRWRAVDPYNNRLYDESVIELSKHDPDFKYARVMFNPFEPEGLLPAVKVAEMIGRFYAPGQRLFFDIQKPVKTFVADHFSGKNPQEYIDRTTAQILLHTSRGELVRLPGADVFIRRWDHPFLLRVYYYEDMWRLKKEADFPFMKTLRRPRIDQLTGRYKEAALAFASLSRDGGDTGLYGEEREYFMILNEYDEKDFTSVEKNVRAYRKKYPLTPRNIMLGYLLAHSLHALGRLEEAVGEYPAGANFKWRGVPRGVPPSN
ncbi:MAG: hypothetical protein A3G34_02985 [Candidatus Lindowbacteria bacterium RIFCSPLOWO2_12_FULL_62_27]|nr:MAG: hypothetical protein A3G34_02985 [Candidatus Lindowbacteria bacterium RIFCSPLOWO2_12_FULL_62_27]